MKIILISFMTTILVGCSSTGDRERLINQRVGATTGAAVAGMALDGQPTGVKNLGIVGGAAIGNDIGTRYYDVANDDKILYNADQYYRRYLVEKQLTREALGDWRDNSGRYRQYQPQGSQWEQQHYYNDLNRREADLLMRERALELKEQRMKDR